MNDNWSLFFYDSTAPIKTFQFQITIYEMNIELRMCMFGYSANQIMMFSV